MKRTFGVAAFFTVSTSCNILQRTQQTTGQLLLTLTHTKQTIFQNINLLPPFLLVRDRQINRSEKRLSKQRILNLKIARNKLTENMQRFRDLFGTKPLSIIGMIHVNPLPGTALYKANSFKDVITKAVNEAKLYLKSGVDGVIVENMHDIPYVQSKYFGPETTASMTKICSEVKNVFKDTKVRCGVQILSCGNKEALAVAKACDFHFIRAEAYVFGHIGDEGYADANAGLLIRYRKNIDAENILVFTDIKKKHSSHAITSDVSLPETAKAAEFFLTDGVILTGTATGSPADETELVQLKKTVKGPILIGSGITYENVDKYLTADAAIIGSYFKKGGEWQNDLDEEKVRRFMEKMKKIRSCIK